jgi:hypothetical protein
MLPSDDATAPDPAPVRWTVSVADIFPNVALTEIAAFIVTVHAPVPLHPPPDQPLNVEPADGLAVSVTAVP